MNYGVIHYPTAIMSNKTPFVAGKHNRLYKPDLEDILP